MYLSKITIENFRCFGERFELPLRRGLTALVGENDAGKSAVIDALRFALGTTDQDWYRLEDTDFYKEGGARSHEISIVCTFEKLNDREKRSFVEYLTYGQKEGDEPILYVNWTAKDTGEVFRGRPYRRVEVHSGKKGDGPTIDPKARELLHATYLRPLRDAEQSLSAGRGSRLAQILQHSRQITTGLAYDPKVPAEEQELSVLGISDLLNRLLRKQKGVAGARDEIDERLKQISLRSENIKSRIDVSGVEDSPESRLRQLLEKLDLSLGGEGKLGLGSNNLLFMACELLLLAWEKEGNKLVLIEEPEAHLHAQRQLQAMRSLQKQAADNGIQVIITTHSPNLASAIKLNNIVMIQGRRAFSMAKGQTELEASDYRFLERFLDVTKANLFFARGVMIVEGDSECILLPTLAHLIDRDLTEHGVSIVNVGSLGLHRYARIFRRKGAGNEEKDKQLGVPVACVTDMDVMPDCAPAIIGKVRDGEEWPATDRRRWRAKSDIGDEKALTEHRRGKEARASGQYVRTLVSDEWTLEYDLALGPKDANGDFSGGLAEDVFVAACLAEKDDAINRARAKVAYVVRTAVKEFAALKKDAVEKDGCRIGEVIASNVYAKFEKHGVSKPIAAQYLAQLLEHKCRRGKFTADSLMARLPKYLVEAIEYVTSTGAGAPEASSAAKGATDE